MDGLTVPANPVERKNRGQTDIFLLEQLTASAQEAGLDLPACEHCVSSGTSQATVPADNDPLVREVVNAALANWRRRDAAPKK